MEWSWFLQVNEKLDVWSMNRVLHGGELFDWPCVAAELRIKFRSTAVSTQKQVCYLKPGLGSVHSAAAQNPHVKTYYSCHLHAGTVPVDLAGLPHGLAQIPGHRECKGMRMGI